MIAVVSVSLVPAIGASGASSRAGSVFGRCEPGGILVDHNLALYTTTLQNHDTHTTACVLASGRRRVIEQALPTSTQFLAFIGDYARGTWLAWSSTSDGRTVATRTLNVQTGRRGPTVRVTSENGVITRRNGPPPDTEGRTGGTLVRLVITTTGDYAWIAVRSNESGLPIAGLYVPDRRGGDRALDIGPVATITNLRVRGKTIRWLHNGSPRRAVLP